MKKGKYVLIIFLIFFFLIVLTFVSFFYYELGRPPSVKARSYFELNLSGEIVERAAPHLFSSLMGMEPLSMHDLWMNIQKAKKDQRIKCVLLRLGNLQCNWAKINEIREAILDFRSSGKKAYAYIQEAPEFDKEYYLATACDEIILHPLGLLGVNGIGGYTPFFKKALNNLGIQAEFVHVEEYKTASNMFTEEGFTPAHKQMMESLYDDLFTHYVKTLADSRGKSEDEIKRMIDTGFYHGKKAVEAGLVDKLLFQDELKNLLKEDGKKLSSITHHRYSKIKPSSLGLNKGKKMALIYGMGLIHTGESTVQTMGSETVAGWIRKARNDQSIKGIIFRVDSPGGSAMASDIIWREVVLTKEKKPVVVSMSDVAGSGGYWISMAAHKIVAQPQTLTGSIGVLSGKFNMEEFYEKMGITSEKLTYGKRADIFSTFRGLTSEEREVLKNQILWIYDQFLTKAAEGRNMEKEEIHKVGKGRVWTGHQAEELGLVDEMGGISKAINLAKDLAGIPEDEQVKLVVWPKKVSFLSALWGRKKAQICLPLKANAKKIANSLAGLEGSKIWAIMPLWMAAD
ncbi:MAG: signal peptide peptidase SppA [Candidatus Aminicenantes bacterium]